MAILKICFKDDYIYSTYLKICINSTSTYDWFCLSLFRDTSTFLHHNWNGAEPNNGVKLCPVVELSKNLTWAKFHQPAIFPSRENANSVFNIWLYGLNLNPYGRGPNRADEFAISEANDDYFVDTLSWGEFNDVGFIHFTPHVQNGRHEPTKFLTFNITCLWQLPQVIKLTPDQSSGG